MLKNREIESVLLKVARQYPVITITGPRQSGKTTLCKKLFPNKTYLSLENLDVRRKALSDPRNFLSQLGSGVILDEIQRAPELLSYIQTEVDEKKKEGQFILTGSAQFELLSHVTQSLAGRTSIATLLPFSFSEAYASGKTNDIDSVLYTGFYPRIFDKGLNPTEAMASYCSTYVDRDVRSLIKVKDLSKFETFLKLCANRTGQIVNFSDLANDAGINHNTAREWLSVLETSYLVFFLRPHFNNLNKRLIKSPKIYFYDTGLAAYLMGAETPHHLRHHPLKGALFESFVISELVKQRTNRQRPPHLTFWRDNTGNEIDAIMDFGNTVLPIEIKSGQTVTNDFFKNLNFYRKINPRCKKAALIYGGNDTFIEKNNIVVSFKDITLFRHLDHRLVFKLPS